MSRITRKQFLALGAASLGLAGSGLAGRELLAGSVLSGGGVGGAPGLLPRVRTRLREALAGYIDSPHLTEPGIDRSTTVIALATQIPYRVVPLAAAATRPDA